jgi:hypothetical protein
MIDNFSPFILSSLIFCKTMERRKERSSVLMLPVTINEMQLSEKDVLSSHSYMLSLTQFVLIYSTQMP